MKDESASILPAIGFAIIAIMLIRHVGVYNIRASRATKRLQEAYLANGHAWVYKLDFNFRKKLFFRPDSIYDPNDLPDIREAKTELVACRLELDHTIWRGIKIMLWGALGMIILMALESGIRHFL